MKHEHLRKARLNLQTLVTSQSAVASRAGRVYLHKHCLIDEVSLNKPRSILLQMSMFQHRSIQQMRSMILGPLRWVHCVDARKSTQRLNCIQLHRHTEVRTQY